MKVSLNWIKEFTDINLPIDELVAKIGAQLGAVEEVVDLGKKYQRIVVAKVVSCVEHPNSDHLHICKIDDGGKVPNVPRDENDHVQVVCGAPNVREGLLVAWLPPGTTVPSTIDKDPLMLEARDIRGQVSNGMLASAHELAMSDDHSGILEITEDVKPGDDFVEVYKLNDYIIDIENKMFTHRPDCFGIMGVAREIAGIGQKVFISRDWYLHPNLTGRNPEAEELKLEITNEVPELCPRYMAVAMSDIKIAPSPLWIQSKLSRVGIRPINNIVDITNYIMMLTGQPLHAFDYDKIAVDGKARIVVRKPRDSEKLTLLGGKEIQPRADAVLICDQDKPVALGGVMGGNNSEIDEHTTRIIIECANFDMYNIRRTAMEHGLFTDAVTRFTKGQSPLQNPAVLAETIVKVGELVGGKQASEIVDDKHLDETETMSGTMVHQIVEVSVAFINARLGLDLNEDEIIKLLEDVEFDAHIVNGAICVQAPFWRTDIEIPEDIIEEVGRLYGYDKLPLVLPRRDLTPAAKDAILELKSKIRHILAAAGANEVLTYSFVHGNLLDKVGQDRRQAFQLANALSPDLQYYRLSLTPSLLDKIHPNIKAGHDEFAIFEIGKGHNLMHKDDDDGLPMEFEMLDVVCAASDVVKKTGASFYEARAFLANLLAEFGIEPEFRPFEAEENYPVVKPYDHARSAKIFVKGTDLPLGMVGEYKPSVRKNLKLPKYSAGFGIGLTQLSQAISQTGKTYTPLPRFPKVDQDICLRVAAEMHYQELFDFVSGKIDKLKPEQTLAELTPVDIYQRDDDLAHKQITLRLSIASYAKTMTDPEVNALLDHVATAAKEKFGAERI